jgi:mRNA interferase RelE/StbE
LTRRLVFETAAINSAAGFLADDPDGLSAAMAAIDQLVDDPRPADSTSFGSSDVRRLRVSRYRVLYRVGDDSVSVIHIGRASG